MVSNTSMNSLLSLLLLVAAVCSDAIMTATTSPQDVTLTCYSDDFKNVACNWTNIPVTHIPTEVSCEVVIPDSTIQSCEELTRVSGEPCSNFNASSREYHFEVSRVVALIRLSVNGKKFCTLFDKLKQTEPHPPDFQVTTLTAKVRSELTIMWEYPGRMYKYLNSPLVYIRNDYDNSTEEVQDGEQQQSKLNRRVTFSNVRYCVRMKSVSKLDVQGPWSDEVCKYTPPRVPNVGIADVSHSDEMDADQSLNRNVTVNWGVEMPTDEPYQGLLGFKVRAVQLFSEAQNLSLSEEYKHSLVNNGNFSLEIPDLLKNESYDIEIAAYNEAGISSPKTHRVDPVAVEQNSVASALLVIFCVIGTMGVLLLVVLFAYSYLRLKNNFNQFPEPIFTRTDHVNLRPVPEPEVFDQPARAATTDKTVSGEIQLHQEYVTMVPSGTAEEPLLVQDKEAGHQEQGNSALSMGDISYTQIGTHSRGNGSTSPYSPVNRMQNSLEKEMPLGTWTTSSGRLASDSNAAQDYLSLGPSTRGQGISGINPEVDKTEPAMMAGFPVNGSPARDVQGAILSEYAPAAKKGFSLPSASTTAYVPFHPIENQVKAYSPALVMSSALPPASGNVDPAAIASVTSAGRDKSYSGSKFSLDESNALPVHAVIGHAGTSTDLKSGCQGSIGELRLSFHEDKDQNASSDYECTPLVISRDQHQELLQSPEKCVSRAPVAPAENNDSPLQLAENCNATVGTGYEMLAPPQTEYVTQAQILPIVKSSPAQQPCEVRSQYYPHSQVF